MGYGQASETFPLGKPVLKIEELVSGAEESIFSVERTIDSLEELLAPAMSQQRTGSCPEVGRTPHDSPLCERVASVSDRINAIDNRIQGIKDRLL